MSTILIVDDDSMVRSLFRDFIQRIGYAVLEAPDGETALELCRQTDIDTVLLDYTLPGINGIEAMQAIKKIIPKVPVIIMTGHGNIQLAVEAMRLGVYDFITKPIDLNLLEPAVRRAVNNYALLREVEDMHISAKGFLEINDLLENLVEERTVELSSANRQLQSEIADRQKAEAALRQSIESFKELSNEFHTLLDAIPDSLLLVSQDLKILWANKGSASGLGIAETNLAGRHCYEAWHNRSAPCERCYALRSFASGNADGTTLLMSNGKLVEVRSFPIKDGDGKVRSVMIIGVDITEKTALMAEAARAGHLASLGELAAGVAHEINNPINGIINYAQIIADKSSTGSVEKDIAGRIMKEGDRIAEIVSSLLSFARQRTEEKTHVSLQQILYDTMRLTEVQIRKEGIDLDIKVSPALPEILANPQQIEQVFLNVISNARYALNQKYPAKHPKKKLEISGEEVRHDGRSHLRIVFHDRGTGISPGVIDKVMNPFFSTKPAGQGTGLGLSISHGIVRDHGGDLRIESRTGDFTKVIIDFPLAGTNCP